MTVHDNPTCLGEDDRMCKWRRGEESFVGTSNGGLLWSRLYEMRLDVG